ncbi:1,2-diacylglycerol 3-beta-galactosyltransferase [Thermoflexales bacterium]|nr:1,2-diacylglycerol 3-beta-galactosyltransferase [Thermoflexales bacterium]
MTKPLRLLLYYADTGGGHRATAQALAEGLKHRYGNAVDPILFDGLRKYAPYPVSHLDDMYPWMSGMSKTWGRGWTQLNDPRVAMRFMKLWWPYVRTAAMRMAKEPCDAIINVQPLYTFPVLWAMERTGIRKPFVTMVSDLIVVHALWCDPTTDRFLVPTEVSRQHALDNRIPEEKIQVVGLPIRLTFMLPPQPKAIARRQLGLDDKFTILLMGGGQGLGRVYETAEAIGRSGLNVQLIVVAGRNKKLKEQLDATHWPITLKAYGFIQEIPTLMDAADVLITKAGPTTICEAFTRSLPIILSGYIPSQENENADYVIDQQAGILAEEPELIVATVREWLHNPDRLAQLSRNSGQLARPRAAIDAAEAAYEVATSRPIVYRAPQGEPLLARLDRFLGT